MPGIECRPRQGGVIPERRLSAPSRLLCEQNVESQVPKAAVSDKETVLHNAYMTGGVESTRSGLDPVRLQTVRLKLKLGSKLSPEEKNLLKQADPVSYQALLQQEEDHKRYLRELERCQNREQVEELKQGRLYTSLSNLNTVCHDPHITDEHKQELCASEYRRTQEVVRVTRKFKETQAYRDLPTLTEESFYREEQHRAALGEKDSDPLRSGDKILLDAEEGPVTYLEIVRRVKRTRARQAAGNGRVEQGLEDKPLDLKAEN